MMLIRMTGRISWLHAAIWVIALALAASLLRGDTNAGEGDAKSGTDKQWWHWRGPTGNGISDETIPAPEELTVRWRKTVGIGSAGMAVANGRLYTVGNRRDHDLVYCINAASGATIWMQSFAEKLNPRMYKGGPNAAPTVAGDRVYVLSRSGKLRCLDVSDGKTMWEKDLPKELGGRVPEWGYAGSPWVADQLLIVDVGGKGASTVAFQRKSGEVLWKAGDDPASYASPIGFTWHDRRVVTSFNAKGLVLRDITNGRELSRFTWETRHDVNAAAPLLIGNRVLVMSGYGKGAGLYDIRTKEAKEVWSKRILRSQFTSPVHHDGYIYGIDSTLLQCVALNDGDVQWTERGTGRGGIVLAGDKLVIQTERGNLVIAKASPKKYEELASIRLFRGDSWIAPAINEGRIYCKSNLGEVACVEVKAKR